MLPFVVLADTVVYNWSMTDDEVTLGMIRSSHYDGTDRMLQHENVL